MNQADLAILVEAQAQSQDALTQMALNAAGQSAKGFTGWYDSTQIGQWASQLASLIESIQGQTAASTDAYLTEVLAGLKGAPVSPSGTIDIKGLRQGVSHTEVYGRAADTYRYEVSQGKSESEALRSAVQRAEVMAETDVQLAQRAQSQRFMTSKKVTGYRRIIHPELSKGGTCGLCVAASDRIYVASDLMPIHARCVPGDTVIRAHGVSAITRRNYPGPLVVLRTASGQQLRVTANHPVLTEDGWVPAGLVEVGDQIVRSRLGHGMTDRRPNEQHAPTTIKQIWRAATVDHSLHLRTVPLASKDFHGDGSDSEVDVVATDGLLADIGDVTFAQPFGELALVDRGGSGLLLSSQGCLGQALFGLGNAPDCLIGSAGHRPSLVPGKPGIPGQLRGTQSSTGDAQFPEAAPHCGATDPERLRDGQFRFAGLVPSKDLVVRKAQPDATRFDPAFAEFSAEGRFAYAQLGRDLRDRLAGDVELDGVVDKSWVEGPHEVFNLQTSEGWYAADNVIVSNCQCTTAPIVGSKDPGHELNLSDLNALYKQAGGSTSGAALKKVRYTVHDNGEIGPVLGVEGQAFRGPDALPLAA